MLSPHTSASWSTSINRPPKSTEQANVTDAPERKNLNWSMKSTARDRSIDKQLIFMLIELLAWCYFESQNHFPFWGRKIVFCSALEAGQRSIQWLSIYLQKGSGGRSNLSLLPAVAEILGIREVCYPCVGAWGTSREKTARYSLWREKISVF